MLGETEIIVKDAIQYLNQEFKQKLRINEIMLRAPTVNMQVANRALSNSIKSSYLQKPQKAFNLNQQFMPRPIKIQNICNFGVHIQNPSQILSLTDSKTQKNIDIIQNSQTKSRKSRLNESKSTFRYSQTKIKQIKQISKQKYQSKQIQKAALLTSNLINLNLNEQKSDEQLQNQIENVKKHLYIMRRYKKQSIEQERQRIQKLMKRKSPQIQKNSHTYQYDGQVVKVAKPNHSTSLVSQLKEKLGSNSIPEIKPLKNINCKDVNMFNYTNEVIIDNNPQRDSPSRQIQKTLFNNSYKRQTSNLPFISLAHNMKITQNSKQVSNQDTTRLSLNRSKFSQRSNQKNFKHYSNIQLQKRLQQSVKKSSLNQFEQNQNEEEFDNSQIFVTKPQNRRQSKMMQKYLKKLGAQKINLAKLQQEQRKSVNFDNLKVPQQFPIQKYYAYNYNNDKMQFQTELTSKKGSIIQKLS